MVTRKEYMAGPAPGQTDFANHRAYYAQMVDDAIKACVLRYIPRVELDHSTDPFLNDIPLYLWDMAAGACHMHIEAALRHYGDQWTMAGGVCVAKEAARQIKETP